MGSNPILSALISGIANTESGYYYIIIMRYTFGEVPKLAEGTPLERVQVVNSGARVQIPPSPLDYNIEKDLKKSKKVVDKTVDTRYYNQADCEIQAIKKINKKVVDKHLEI